MLSSYVTPTYMHGLDDTNRETRSMFVKKNLVRRIVGVKRAYKRRIDELRVAVGMKERFKRKLVMWKEWELKTGKESRRPERGKLKL